MATSRSARWISVVRRAAHELVPVHVRREPGLTLASFLSGIVRFEGEEAVRISPCPPSIGAGPCWLDAPTEGWRLRCMHSVRRDDDLFVRLTDARFETLPHEAPVDLASLVLVCPTGIDDLFVHPVVELGPHGCTIEAAIGLPRGHAFPHVELHGDRGVLRTASAVVTDGEPWIDHFGRSSFRYRLRFDVPITQDRPTDYDVITDAERIDRVLGLASLLALELVTDEPTAEVRRLVESQPDRLRVDGGTWSHIGPVEIAFELFALRYEATVRVLGANTTTRPLLLRRRRRRTESRVDTRTRSLRVHFDHPLRPTGSEAALLDLSARGLCFAAADEPLLWPGLVLERTRVAGPRGPVTVGKVEVRSVEGDRAHLRILRDDVATDVEFGELLSSLRHPDLTAHDGASFATQLALYQRSGLVMPYMAEILAAGGESVKHAWRTAHASPDLCRTFARYEDGDAVASVTALQAWDRTWLGQHLAARPDRTGCTPGELLMTFMDYVVLRPDCRQMVFFVAASNDRMNAIQTRFQELTGTPEAAVRVPLRAWLFRDPPEGEAPRAATPTARRVIARSALRDWGPLGVRAFSLDERSLQLEHLSRRFSRVGLNRTREIRTSADGSLPRWASITERCDPGLCIPALLQATWLLPLHSGEDDERHVRSLVSGLTLAPDEPHRIVLTSATLPRAPFEAAGLTHAYDAHAYVLNRAGLRRYASYLLESYGAKGATRSDRRHAS